MFGDERDLHMDIRRILRWARWGQRVTCGDRILWPGHEDPRDPQIMRQWEIDQARFTKLICSLPAGTIITLASRTTPGAHPSAPFAWRTESYITLPGGNDGCVK